MAKAAIWIAVLASVLLGTVYFLKPEANPVAETKTDGPSLTFSPSTLKLSPGKQATIQVALDPAGLPVAALTLDLSFDAGKLKVTSLTNGTVFSNVLSSAKLGQGTAAISLATPPDSKGITQAGTIATLVVESLSSSETVLTFGADTMAVSLSQDGNVLKNMGQLTLN